MNKRWTTSFRRGLSPLVRFLVHAHLSPSIVTLAGLVGVLASCTILLLTRQLLFFCGLVAVCAVLDAVDGAVARASDRVTSVGAYLDALCDRYTEGAVVLSVAVVTGYWVLSGLVLLGALLVSYAKARAAMEVPIANEEWPDLLERPERGALYLIGLAMSQLVAWRPLGHDLFWWTLALLALLIHGTVIQRILRATRFIAARR